MKKVKYRYWCNWCEEFIEPLDVTITIKNDRELLFSHHNNHLLNPQQYTGIEDKNREEIYEGDILRCYDKSGEKVYDKKVTMEMRYTEIWFDGTCDIEIIGNIYENPKLLETLLTN